MHLLCSAAGPIRHLLLFAPEYEAEHFAAIYGALVASLPADAAITVAAEPGAQPHIARWPCDPARLAIVEIPDISITPWARDPLIAAAANGAPALLTTPELERRDDLRAAATLAEKTELASAPSPVAFEGGNILVGESHLFVGVDTLTALGDDGAALFETALRDLEGDRREIVPIGSADDAPSETFRTAHAGEEEWREIFHYRAKEGTRQPVFHIDMFLTLAGKGAGGGERILVGDPAMAAEMLGLPPHPLCLANRFNAIAADLEARGFAVTRNPLPMIYMDDPKKRRRTWYYASSNNALVQREPDIVWLPAYGHDNWPELEITDRQNREIWEGFGFEVRMIGEAQKLAENLGGLHCLTNVLRRS
ncbi:hypothetical protein [Parasphingopyxis marina]|uniref:Agmatine deiminase n=1 Tax=Parasphingopyxis marina TaxID=2761622 RepID=A0A842HVY5_9SPHN|nr:hypothetical protein [Parasphingopyxis marina]MBC2777065.1 hypothetical protein [Parasphingopyxis marina]